MRLRCGKIRYTNAIPLYAPIESSRIAFSGEIVAGVPSQLNAMLLRGDLDLSPVSAFAWAAHAPELVLLAQPCIGARREVLSVVLASPLPPDRLGDAEIAVTPDSESGVHLLRVLLERRLGVRPRYHADARAFERALAGEPALLIGDAAIAAAERLPREDVYDLGELWHAWTGGDMVFAVWCARRDAYRRDPDAVWACVEAFEAARRWSAEHSDETIAAAQAAIDRSAEFYARYYRALNFDFDAGARAGLARYVREVHALGAIADAPPVAVEERYVVAG